MHERQGKGPQHTCGGTTALDLASHDHNPPMTITHPSTIMVMGVTT